MKVPFSLAILGARNPSSMERGPVVLLMALKTRWIMAGDVEVVSVEANPCHSACLLSRIAALAALLAWFQAFQSLRSRVCCATALAILQFIRLTSSDHSTLCQLAPASRDVQLRCLQDGPVDKFAQCAQSSVRAPLVCHALSSALENPSVSLVQRGHPLWPCHSSTWEGIWPQASIACGCAAGSSTADGRYLRPNTFAS